MKRFRFRQGATIDIGRFNDNHIVIENLAVSGHHARIESVGEGYLLTDLKSKNGTLVNGEPISTRWLNHGDTIGIVKHILVFAYTEDELDLGSEAGFADMNIIKDAEAFGQKFADNAGQKIVSETDGNVKGLLVFLHGGQGEIELDKPLTRVGKSTSSDIVIKGLLVGKTAFVIYRKKDGYYLSYVSGIAKPRVNRQIVKDTLLLNDFDTIDIGSAAFQFLKKK